MVLPKTTTTSYCRFVLFSVSHHGKGRRSVFLKQAFFEKQVAGVLSLPIFTLGFCFSNGEKNKQFPCRQKKPTDDLGKPPRNTLLSKLPSREVAGEAIFDSILMGTRFSGWWFQTCLFSFIFILGKSSNLSNIFEMG